MKKLQLLFTSLLVPIDLCGVILATLIASNLRTALDILPIGEGREVSIGLFFLIWYAPTLIFLLGTHQLYQLSNLPHRVNQLFGIVSASGAAAMLLFMAVLFGRTPYITTQFPAWSTWAFGTSLLTVFYLWLSTIVVLTALRWFYRSIIQSLYSSGFGCLRVLLVGNTEVARTLEQSIRLDNSIGLKIIGVVNSNGGETLTGSLGSLSDLPTIVSQLKPDRIIMADPDLRYEKTLQIIEVAHRSHIDFTFAPNLFEVLSTNVTVSNIGGIPLLNLRRTPLDGWGNILKRLMDVAVAIILCVILLPVMIVVAMLIKLQDGGPVFYRQSRVCMGLTFKIFKFRSMIKDAEMLEDELRLKTNERSDGPLFKMKNDPRVTKLGRVLRKSRVDEIPQLFNVLAGQMSLVGPRPHLAKEIAQYQTHHRKVLAIKPGMTGLAQLSGSSDLTFDEEVRLDTYYVENWSLMKDIEILLKTPFIVLFKDRSGV